MGVRGGGRGGRSSPIAVIIWVAVLVRTSFYEFSCFVGNHGLPALLGDVLALCVLHALVDLLDGQRVGASALSMITALPFCHSVVRQHAWFIGLQSVLQTDRK